MNETKLIDLMGNIDLGMLVDKIVEKDMKCSTKKGKIFLLLFPLILLVFIVVLICLLFKRR